MIQIPFKDYLDTNLRSASNGFGASFKDLYERRAFKYLTEEKKLRTVIVPASRGTVSLIDSNTKREKGVSDFDGNKLNAEETFIITHIKLGYDTNADDDKAGVLAYKRSPSNSVRNAVLTIEQDNIQIFKKEVSSLLDSHTTTKVVDDLIALPIPIVIHGGKTFDFSITYPLGATPVATGNEYLETVLIGAKAVRSAMAV